jgi:hypothetical protein
MQLIGFFAVIAFGALMVLSGYQIVPESATNRADASGSDGFVSAPTFVTPSTEPRSTTNPDISPTTETAPVFAPAVITSKAAQNIEANSALLRGDVSVGTETIGDVFYIYGYNKTDVDRSIAAYTTYDQVLANKRTEANVTRATRSLTRDKEILHRVSDLAPDTKYYVRLCAERVDQLSCSQVTSFTTIPGAYSVGEVRIPTIRITDESAMKADEMMLEMTIAMRDTVDGDVYLIYGESQAKTEDAREQTYSRVDADDQQLQKTRIVSNIRGTQRLFKTVDDLEADTLVYYIVCVEYDGLRDGTVCTRTQSFKTYDEDYGVAPSVQTDAVVVSGTSARLSGSVRMREFNDGKVFFVYGTDLERVTRVAGETSMERLQQTQDRFQRVLVASDLDGNDEYAKTVRDLLPGTLYAARLCVEYQNQNESYRDTAFVKCGELRSFIIQ